MKIVLTSGYFIFDTGASETNLMLKSQNCYLLTTKMQRSKFQNLLLLFFLCNLSCNRLQTPSFMLTSVNTSLSNVSDKCSDVKDPFVADLILDTVQLVNTNGIRFSVKLVNNTDSQISINAPPNLIAIGLLDSSGKNLLYSFIPKVLVYNKHAYKNYSYTISKMTLNRKLLHSDPYDIEIRLPVSGELEVFYMINTVFKEDANKTVLEDQLIPLAKGEYILHLSIQKIYPDCLRHYFINRTIKYLNKY